MAQSTGVPRWSEFRKSLSFEIGLGSVTPNISDEDPRKSFELISHSAFPNVNAMFGASAKLGIVQFEAKVGYGYLNYTSSSRYNYFGRPNYTLHEHSGNVQNHSLWIQPLGINFGKDRKWGSIILGGFVRLNVLDKTITSGTSYYFQSSWNGTTMEESERWEELSPIYSFGPANVGCQAGAEINLPSNNKLQLRGEFLVLSSEYSDIVGFRGLTFQVGFVFGVKEPN